MKFIVGLGNPGKAYQDTRHNAGWMLLDFLKEALKKQQPIGEWTQANDLKAMTALCGETVLVKPLTFVNLSGQVVSAILKKWPSASREDFLIVCDEVQLPLGTLRLRRMGTAGGHHGLESIIQTLDSEAVARLRLGVGVEAMPKDLSPFVLGSFSIAEKPLLEQALTKGSKVCQVWVKEGWKAAVEILSLK